MLAGQFTNRRCVELIEIDEPKLDPAVPDQMVFQPELTCLCGSDLPFFDGDFEGHEITYPYPVGHSLHEMVGTVIATTGSRFTTGERVLAVPIQQHGFFERFVISDQRAMSLPDGLADEQSLLAQPFGTVLFALKKLPNMIDRDVVVVGQGPIGQLFNTGLRSLGARHIIGIDPLADRLKLSHVMGATETVCSTDSDPVAAVRDILDGELPDVVIEAVGHRAQAMNDCIHLTRYNGTLLYFGVPPNTIDGVHWREAMGRNLTILTSMHPGFERDFPIAMRWIQEGRVDLSPLITHRFKLAQAQAAFDLFRDRRDGAQKVLLEFPAWTSNSDRS